MHPLAVDLERVDVLLGPSVTDAVEDHRARVAELARVVEIEPGRRRDALEPERDRALALQRAKRREVLVRAGGVDHTARLKASKRVRRERGAASACPWAAVHPVERHVRD